MFRQENIDSSFKLVHKAILNTMPAGSKTPCIETSWLERYTINKAWLFKYFDEDGRMELPLGTGVTKTLVSVTEYVGSLMDKFEDRLAQVEVQIINHVEYNTTKLIRKAFVEVINIITPTEFLQNSIAKNIAIEGHKFCAGTKVSKVMSSVCLCKSADFIIRPLYEQIQSKEELFVKDYVKVITYFWSLIAQEQTQCSHVVLSINPVDIIMCSEDAAFTSCHKITNGAYKAGVPSLLCDGVTAIAYAWDVMKSSKLLGIDTPYKVWRQNVYFDKENFAALMFREFPNEKQAVHAESRRLAATILYRHAQEMNVSCEFKWKVYMSKNIYKNNEEYQNKRTLDSCVYNNTGLGYGGDDYSSVIVLNTEPPHAKVYVRYGTQYECPTCGRIRTSGDDVSSFSCGNCAGSRCEICGEAFDGSYNEHACDNCLDNGAAQCADCGDWVAGDSCYYIESTDEHVCDNCASRHYVTCVSCSDLHHRSECTETHDGYVCDGCLEDLYVPCKECGEYVKIEDAKKVERYKGRLDTAYLCGDCFSMQYGIDQCRVCSCWADVSGMVYVNGVHMCLECAESKQSFYGEHVYRCDVCSTLYKSNETVPTLHQSGTFIYCENCGIQRSYLTNTQMDRVYRKGGIPYLETYNEIVPFKGSFIHISSMLPEDGYHTEVNKICGNIVQYTIRTATLAVKYE